MTAKTKRAPRAKTPAPTPANDTLAPSTIETVAYALTTRAPENVRRTDIAADVDSLADDIAAHGLLQSLIGYRGDSQPDEQIVYIVGGGRRLQALELLHDRGVINDEWPVPVLIRTRDEAIELSLSENLARRDMNPADEFRAFDQLMAPGALSPADLAKRFGFTERYVKQRLRLANLHGDILEAVREGKIGIDSAMAYASTTNTELQHKIFKRANQPNAYNGHSPSSIRTQISADQLTDQSPVFQFIDAATYEKEGGGYEEDLFDRDLYAPKGRRLDNGSLALLIAARCLQFQSSRILEQERHYKPTVVSFVLPKGMMLGGSIDVPSGYVQISGGWNSQLSVHVDIGDCWKRAIKENVLIQIEIGIGLEDYAADDDDGSERQYVAKAGTERFFVPREMAKVVWPKKQATTYVGRVMTDEERAEALLVTEARLWAARLSIPNFNDIPGFEGKVFYDRSYLDMHMTKPGDPVSGDRTPSFNLRVFVTEDEIAANLEAGRARAIAERDAIEAHKAEREAKKQAEADARAAAWKAATEGIAAMEAEPAVVVGAEYEGDEGQPYYRWADGSYMDVPEDSEDADCAGGSADLEDLFEVLCRIDSWHANAADYQPTEEV